MAGLARKFKPDKAEMAGKFHFGSFLLGFGLSRSLLDLFRLGRLFARVRFPVSPANLTVVNDASTRRCMLNSRTSLLASARPRIRRVSCGL
jgi:hypothetical protein